MSTARRHRSPTIQLELPLHSPPAEDRPSGTLRRTGASTSEPGASDARASPQPGPCWRTGPAHLEDTAATRIDGDAGGGHRKAGRAA